MTANLLLQHKRAELFMRIARLKKELLSTSEDHQADETREHSWRVVQAAMSAGVSILSGCETTLTLSNESGSVGGTRPLARFPPEFKRGLAVEQAQVRIKLVTELRWES